MQSTGLVDQIYLEQSDSRKIFSQYPGLGKSDINRGIDINRKIDELDPRKVNVNKPNNSGIKKEDKDEKIDS